MKKQKIADWTLKISLIALVYVSIQLIFVLAQKAHFKIDDAEFTVTQDLQTILGEYRYDKKRYLGEKTGKINIRFVKFLHPTLAGWCEVEKNEILLSYKKFKKMPYMQKKELVYHELGHCDLWLGHTPGTIMRRNLGEFYELPLELMIRDMFLSPGRFAKFIVLNKKLTVTKPETPKRGPAQK